MSLKAFHVVFIVISLLLTLFFGIWGIQSYQHTGNGMHLGMAIGSLVGAVFLIWYFKWFLRKLKNESYL
jgi:Cu/Ag efflux pump CusA